MRTLTNQRLLGFAFAALLATNTHADDFSMSSSYSLAQVEPQNVSHTDRYSSADPSELSTGRDSSAGVYGVSHSELSTRSVASRNSSADADDIDDRGTHAGSSTQGQRAVTTPAGNAKSRSGNRWQSLVPGAIR